MTIMNPYNLMFIQVIHDCHVFVTGLVTSLIDADAPQSSQPQRYVRLRATPCGLDAISDSAPVYSESQRNVTF